jgi:hypothetical protein
MLVKRAIDNALRVVLAVTLLVAGEASRSSVRALDAAHPRSCSITRPSVVCRRANMSCAPTSVLRISKRNAANRINDCRPVGTDVQADFRGP